jgi:hypothetical protein
VGEATHGGVGRSEAAVERGEARLERIEQHREWGIEEEMGREVWSGGGAGCLGLSVICVGFFFVKHAPQRVFWAGGSIVLCFFTENNSELYELQNN